jgi:hypothetical protein
MSARWTASLALSLILAVSAPGVARADFLAITWSGETIRINPTSGAWIHVGASGHADLNSMTLDSGGRYVTANKGSSEIPHLLHVDPFSGRATVFHLPFLNDIRALALSPSGVLYATDADPSGVSDGLYTLDPTVPYGDSSIRHFVGQTSIAGIQGMTFASDGTLYAWSVSNGLIVIDPATAQATDVDGLMNSTSAIQTLTFTPEGRLFGAGDALFSIDRATGARAQIGSTTLPSVRGMEFFDSLSPFPFCVAKTNSQGCVPAIAFSGSPTRSGPDTFLVSASGVLNHETGILLWSPSPIRFPLQLRTVCVHEPVFRTPSMDSGGNPPPTDCSGAFSFHFSQALMTAHGLLPGTTVDAQYFYKDPAQTDGTGTGLTDALHFTIGP